MENHWEQAPILLHEITQGVSKLSEGLYIRHMGLGESAKFEELKKRYFYEAINKGFPTIEDSRNKAKNSGEWTDDDEKRCVNQEHYVNKMISNGSNIEGPQRQYFLETLQKEQSKLRSLLELRSKAIGKTAESWADKVAFEEFVPMLFFEDVGCSRNKYSDDQIGYFSDEEYAPIYQGFLYLRERFSEPELKTLAVSPLCQNLFFSGNDLLSFFGKPVTHLTEVQARAFMYIKYYNQIISNLTGRVKPSVLKDWKSLDNWASGNDKSRERLENQWGDKSEGMTYEDVQRNAKLKHQNQSEKMKSLTKLVK